MRRRLPVPPDQMSPFGPGSEPAEHAASASVPNEKDTGHSARGPPAAMSIKNFCRTHQISESFYHKLMQAGLGPRVMRIGKRTLITAEAAARWRAEREAATEAAAR